MMNQKTNRCCNFTRALAMVMLGLIACVAWEAGAVPEASQMTKSMREKWTQCLEQGRTSYRNADFKTAIEWYESAAQLNAGDADLQTALAEARDRFAAQQRALSELPDSADDRENVFRSVFKNAFASYKTGEYKDAKYAFETLWLVAGDYRGKTLDLIAACDEQIEAGSVPVQPRMDAPASTVESAGVMVAEIASDAPTAAPVVVDDVTRIEVTRLVRDAKLKMEDGDRESALSLLEEALDAWPGHSEAQQLYDEWSVSVDEVAAEATPVAMNAGSSSPVEDNLELRLEIDELISMGIDAYERGDLRTARDQWQRVLKLDPANKRAQVWLEQTDAAFERQLATEDLVEEAEARQQAAEKLLNSPITIATDRRISLSEFMNILSFSTPIELEYYIAEGADALIFANFVDKPLRVVLDKVLLDIGLSWEIDESNIITIRPNLQSRTFNLLPGQMSKVNAMIDSGELQNIIWGQQEPPSKGVSMVVDERQRILIVTGSEEHIRRMVDFLPALDESEAPALEVEIYRINEKDGPKIKALINSLIRSVSDSPFDVERLLTVDGNTLIVRDTPENILLIEELLLDNDFIEQLRNEELEIQNFSLVPQDVADVQSDYVKFFTTQVINMVETFLYAKDGRSYAISQGRRLWFDENSLQLTIVDTPSNLSRVSSYIDSLPQLGQESRQDVIFLKYAVAENLSSSISRFLDLTSSDSGSGGGNEVTFSLRRGDEREFRDARIRVMRIEDGDEDDKNDDTVEVSINTGQNVSTQNIRELDTVYTDDFEITAEDVIPSSGTPGEGSARLRIRYVAPEDNDDNEDSDTPAVDPLLEDGIQIDPFGDLNALIIRYTDPEAYRDAIELIEILDRPTKQVEIETKFVQVNESRAKEFKSDFQINGLGQDDGSWRSIDYGTSLVNTQFAQDIDEFSSAFEPYTGNIMGPVNHLKGTTAISAVIGGYPNIQYSLSMLESEGVINVVNGPKVVALDGSEATFRIEQFANTDNTADAADNPLMNISDPFQNLPDIDLAIEDEGGGDANNRIISAVVLRFTPQITSDESIILEQLEAELVDFEGYMSQIATPVVNELEEANEVLYSAVVPPRAQVTGALVQRRKRVETDARISNGGTIVLGGWTGELTQEYSSGVPVLRNLPYIGKMFFGREQRSRDRTTLLIFLTGTLIDSD